MDGLTSPTLLPAACMTLLLSQLYNMPEAFLSRHPMVLSPPSFWGSHYNLAFIFTDSQNSLPGSSCRDLNFAICSWALVALWDQHIKFYTPPQYCIFCATKPVPIWLTLISAASLPSLDKSYISFCMLILGIYSRQIPMRTKYVMPLV